MNIEFRDGGEEGIVEEAERVGRKIIIRKTMVDWTHAHRLWAKWASIYYAGGVDGDASGAGLPPLKAALLIHYDPSAPSRLMSVIATGYESKACGVGIIS
ncbi:hypothetical protein QJS10_CPA05g01632 [Acorus calamus]|uniref:Uncharacterized protein n=1 Tax=Acorus calamus TaxID=4465 RepID=A0AAV9EV02_ACOCL|nr:hypothetical protein QJS10_CPA05g01632 [Acorus calamus]